MKRNIILINLSGALLWMGMYTYVPTMPAYAASIGASVVMIGILAGVYGLLQTLLRIPLGIISDKINKDRLLLLVGFAVLIAANLLFVLQDDDIGLMILARSIAGAAAAWWVVICAAYTKYHSEDEQVKAQGVLSASASAGKMVAAVLCAIVAQFFGYKATFISALAVAVLGFVLMTGIKEQKNIKPHEPVRFKEQMALFKNKELMIFCVLGMVSQLVCFGVCTTFTPVAAEALNADSFTLGMLLTVYFAAVTLGSLIPSSGFYRRFGGIAALVLGTLLQLVSAVPLFYHVNIPLIFLMQALSGVGYGVYQSVLSGFVVRSVAPAQRGMATGIFQSIYGLGILFGPMITGFIAGAAGLDAGYWVMAAIAAASVFICLAIPKKYVAMT